MALAVGAGFVSPQQAHAAGVSQTKERVNLNRAGLERLCTLPGIGPKKAQAIIDHRRKAPFTRVSQLIQIRGIGIFLEGAFPQTLPFWGWATLIVVVMLVYSEIGGLKAIIYSDAMQGVLLLAASLVIAFLCLLSCISEYTVGGHTFELLVLYLIVLATSAAAGRAGR